MQNLHIASSIGIISCKVPHTNNFDPTCVHLNSAMKTYTKCDELASAVKSIVKIIDQKVHGSKDLADKLRFVAWKEAVRRVAEVVDSVCNIVRSMHKIPLTVIVAKRFCKWHERVGWETEGHPFPKWRLIMHPDKAHFNNHPWLQTVERCFDLQCTGFKTSAFPPAAQPLLETLPKAASHKGKEKALDTEVKAMIEDDNGEDELSNRQSWTPKPKLVKQEEVDELDEENQDEDMAMDMPGCLQKKPCTSNNASKPPPQSQSHPVVMIPQGWPVDVWEELNQLFQFHDTISAQMLQVKMRLNAVDGCQQATTPGLVEECIEDGNDGMAGSGDCGDDGMGRLEGDLAVGSMAMQEAQFDQGQLQDVGTRNAPPKASQTGSDVTGLTNKGLQPVGMEWEHQSEDVGTLGGYIQGVFSDTECPPSQ
ncbi:hypothetical protein BKA82DRAFT_4018112 [Pisolithus tinctorius]|nr:hypothetical protein BKA82DRAFT_4018112 [Pisolithus tinctorius]